MGRCLEGYEKICFAHDVCVLGMDVREAGQGMPRDLREELVRWMLESGLLKRRGTRYDASRLCEAYRKYIECVKKSRKPLWTCYKQAFNGGA